MPTLARQGQYTDGPARIGFIAPTPIPARAWYVNQASPDVAPAGTPGPTNLAPPSLVASPSGALQLPPATRAQASGSEIGATATPPG